MGCVGVGTGCLTHVISGWNLPVLGLPKLWYSSELFLLVLGLALALVIATQSYDNCLSDPGCSSLHVAS